RKQKGVLWAGSDDGLVHVTKDEGKTWTNVTANIPGMPDWGTVTCIEASPHDAGTAYLVVRNHRMDDYKPYVWKTTNFGQSWTAISDGLDDRVHCHAVREDGKKKGLLYLGTEHGVMYSPDAGKTWKSLQLNLPTVPVHDLVVKDNDLVVGTHGRSIWILDDLTPVRETTEAVKAKAAHLFPVQPVNRWRPSGNVGGSFTRQARGENPADGAVVWFQLGPKFKGEAKIEITDSKGNLVAKAAGKFADKAGGSSPPEPPKDKDEDDDDDGPPPRKMEPKPGLNRVVWDLTHESATTIPGAPVDSGSAAARVPVAPGTYTVKLIAGGQTLTQTVEVKPDPRWAGSAAAAANPFTENILPAAGKSDGKFDWKELTPAQVEEIKK